MIIFNQMLKKIFNFLILLIIAINVGLYLTDNMHIYKTLAYNYVDIDDNDLFHQRIIKAGNPMPWNIGPDYNKAELDQATMDELVARESVAFLIVKDDSIRYERYWEDYSSEVISNSFSMAKSIIGLLIGIAIDEGKIKSLDDKAGDYINHFNNEAAKDLTIRNLLSMSSGLDWDESYGSMFSLTTKAYYGNDLEKMVNEMKVIDKPGVSYKYLSGNTLVLGMILENAVGKSISDYASEKLWTPINAENDAEWSLDDEDGLEKCYCCFYSNARDFARIGKLILNQGQWNDTQVISKDFIREALTPPRIYNERGFNNKKYGLHWWIMERNGHSIYYARGILGQYIAIIPDQNLVMVRLGHIRGDKNTDGHLSDFVIYIDGVLKLYG